MENAASRGCFDRWFSTEDMARDGFLSAISEWIHCSGFEGTIAIPFAKIGLVSSLS